MLMQNIIKNHFKIKKRIDSDDIHENNISLQADSDRPICSQADPNEPIEHTTEAIFPNIQDFININNDNFLDLDPNVNLPISEPQNIDLIIAYIVRHKLTDKASNDLLKLLTILEVKEIPNNIQKLYNVGRSHSFFFCDCQVIYKSSSFQCESCQSISKNFFYTSDFIYECKRILPQFFKSGSLIDVTLHTDGINPFSKSKYSIWPVYLIFNDIPINQRFKLKNILICGVWYGKMKPPMQVLFDIIFTPYLDSINSSFKIDEFIFSLSIKFIIADKPARSSILNMQSSNAEYFCPVCLAKSQTIVINSKRHVFVPIVEPDKINFRTHAGFVACAYSSEQTKLPEYGIKGSSFIQNFANTNIISCNIFDYMHSICLGVIKSLIHHIFFTKPSAYSSLPKIKLFDKVLKQIHIPSKLNKSFALLADFGIWKAKDFRNFFLFAFPFLFLEENVAFKYFIHDLRKGLILLLNNVSDEDQHESEICFRRFLVGFSEYFGFQYLTPNFHDLFHLPKMAKSCGSLVDYSGFNFEHVNGALARLCKGNKRFDIQIIKRINILSTIETKINRNNSHEKSNFLKYLLDKIHWKGKLIIKDDITACGKIESVIDLSWPSNYNFFINGYEYMRCSRLILKNNKLSTSKYSKGKVFKDSFLVSSDHKTLIEITDIIIRCQSDSKECFILFDEFKITKKEFYLYQKQSFLRKNSIEADNILENYTFAVVGLDHIIPVPRLGYY